MDALKAVESSAGLNNYPRIEPAYMPLGAARIVQGRSVVGTGKAFNAVVAHRWQRWGMASACSWGPWQILYHTAADLGYAEQPWLLWDEYCSSMWVNKRLDKIALRGAVTVEEFADAWNSGTHKDTIVPKDYIAKVVAAYLSLP